MSVMVERVARALEAAWQDCLSRPGDFVPGKMPSEHFARAVLEEVLPPILRIVRDQPYYPDTHTGMRQQWVKDQIAEKIMALGGKNE